MDEIDKKINPLERLEDKVDDFLKPTTPTDGP